MQTPLGTITIRPALVSDAQAYRELRLEALLSQPEAFSADYALNKRQPIDWWEDRLRRIGTSNMFYFAVHADELVGTCGIFRGESPKTQHSGTIIGVYVRPEWRGLRIADGMIAGCVNWGLSQGIKVFKLGVVTTNTAAIRCYTRCGFKVYGIEPQAIFYDGVMYDELLMARSV